MTRAPPWLPARARISAAQPALEVADESISYAELHDRARGAAERLRALGVGPGDVVAALLGNGAPFVEVLHAATLCGASLLPQNIRLTPPEGLSSISPTPSPAFQSSVCALDAS